MPMPARQSGHLLIWRKHTRELIMRGNTNYMNVVYEATKNKIMNTTGEYGKVEQNREERTYMNKIIHKVKILLFLAISLLGTNHITAQAQNTPNEIKTYGYYQYQYDQETDSIHIVGYRGDEEVVVIPSEIEGNPVTEIDGFGDWNESCHKDMLENVKEVYIPEGVVKIGVQAFYCCATIEKIQLPSSLKIIEYGAFWECSMLAEVKLPDSLERIEDCAFAGCSSIKEINIPDTVTKVGYSAFGGCSKLSKVKLSNNLTVIEEDSFSWCNIKSIQIPDKVTKIEKNAFRRNKLKEVKIPSNVTHIGAYAFSFNKLKKVTIPSNVTHIGGYAFWSNSSLEEITISSGVKQIGYESFAKCKNLRKIKIKGTKIKTIKKGAFLDIHKKAIFDVPNKLKRKYKKMLIASNSFNEKTMKIK